MSGNCAVSLESFYIFNSQFGPEEGEEHKKILFYHPQDVDTDIQIRNVGLSEAVLKFTETFNPSSPCETMHTQKTKQFFHQPEDEFWMIMTVSIPFCQKAKDGHHSAENTNEDVQDNVFLSILRLSYLMFRFFQGTFHALVNKSGVDYLRQRITMFFSRYLVSLKLSQADLADVFNGICFLPLDKNTFLKVHCFVNLIETTFSQIKYVAFLYNEQLVWSGLEQEDMQILYKYLVSSLYPFCLESEIHTGLLSPNRPNLPPFSHSHYGRFVTGPTNLANSSDMGKVPRVHVNVLTDDGECHLVVYRALSASVCLLIDSSFQLHFDFYKKLDSFLGPQLTSLASHIADVYSKKLGSMSGEPQFKYIYFNHMNLAQKSTIHVGYKSNAINVPPEVMKLLTDVNSDLKSLETCGEIFIKSMTDCWVVGKVSDERELYVFINQKNANLIEVSDEVKKLCSTHFENIFFVD